MKKRPGVLLLLLSLPEQQPGTCLAAGGPGHVQRTHPVVAVVAASLVDQKKEICWRARRRLVAAVMEQEELLCWRVRRHAAAAAEQKELLCWRMRCHKAAVAEQEEKMELSCMRVRRRMAAVEEQKELLCLDARRRMAALVRQNQLLRWRGPMAAIQKNNNEEVNVPPQLSSVREQLLPYRRPTSA
jgi:hypothetical protein